MIHPLTTNRPEARKMSPIHTVLSDVLTFYKCALSKKSAVLQEERKLMTIDLVEHVQQGKALNEIVAPEPQHDGEPQQQSQ